MYETGEFAIVKFDELGLLDMISEKARGDSGRAGRREPS